MAHIQMAMVVVFLSCTRVALKDSKEMTFCGCQYLKPPLRPLYLELGRASETDDRHLIWWDDLGLSRSMFEGW